MTESILHAFETHGIEGVYLFSSTAPLEDDPSLARAHEMWTDAGHHIGNHGHAHASLNWADPDAFIEDVRRSERFLSPWLEQAPRKYFRFPMDMWGDPREKTDAVLRFLVSSGYMTAPATYWFYDAQFILPHTRAVTLGNDADRSKLVDLYVETGVHQYQLHRQQLTRVFDREVPLIGLAHGSAITAEALSRYLGRLLECGVEFVSLEEAMTDPVNAYPPPISTPMFRNATQKWSEALGHEFDGVPPTDVLLEVDAMSPIDGMDYDTVFGGMRQQAAAALGGKVDAAQFDWRKSH
ncbi:hypothetical protein BHE97_17755 [Aeromicrobium sp. PE09-221]|uniref:polysaccharide deacetylase family protein n=1 Tax=Aeromicrobium sp. PE09-221 TaxID=1898043 RepID=UPI000B68E635|nr:polysaccharide deacetylase family protein [Aeromicrobium sp. PE09-221]OUZ07344.1 hypothetical protein BHE97_17755 [Aeromicrobium sp. PE09-221]